MLLSELINKLGSAISNSSLNDRPEYDPEITALAPIDEAVQGSISYIEGDKFANFIETTEATVIVLPDNAELQRRANDRGLAWISSKQARLLFAQVIKVFYQPFRPQSSIHPTAFVDPTVVLGKDVYVGPNAVIHGNVTLGDRVIVHGNVVIYPDVQIGEGTILHGNCTIQERSRLGADCVIHSGVVVGSEGFGFVPTATGWFKMEQAGYTILEDRVEIGANSTIDRPAVGETRIGHDTKLDNLVHIGHGCKIGSFCAFAAQVGIAGGTKVGNQVLLGGQVGVANQVVIGDRSQVGAKAGIHTSIEADSRMSGYPAIPHSQWLRVSSLIARLPEIYKILKKQ